MIFFEGRWSEMKRLPCKYVEKLDVLKIGTLRYYLKEQIKCPWMVAIPHDPFGLDETIYSGVYGESG